MSIGVVDILDVDVFGGATDAIVNQSDNNPANQSDDNSKTKHSTRNIKKPTPKQNNQPGT
jgi:hypothetical protein